MTTDPDLLPLERRYECHACKQVTRLLQVHPGRVSSHMECRARGFGECPGDAFLVATVKGSADISVDDVPWELFNPYIKVTVPSDENRAVAAAYSTLDVRSRRARAEATS